jgi:hypothetical protein
LLRYLAARKIPRYVFSQMGYAVHVEFDPSGQLVSASCTCLDFPKRAPDLPGVQTRKHLLAACLKTPKPDQDHKLDTASTIRNR